MRSRKGIGDTLCILSKLPELCSRNKDLALQFNIRNPLEAIDIFSCFKFTYNAIYSDGKHHDYIPVDEAFIHYNLFHIPDKVVTEAYWNIDNLTLQYDIIVHPVTTSRTMRVFDKGVLYDLLDYIADWNKDSSIILVGSEEDVKFMGDYDNPAFDNQMNKLSAYQVVQLLFEAKHIIGCDSWIAFLGGIIGKPTFMYMLNRKTDKLLNLFRDRVISDQFHVSNLVNCKNELQILSFGKNEEAVESRVDLL